MILFKIQVGICNVWEDFSHFAGPFWYGIASCVEDILFAIAGRITQARPAILVLLPAGKLKLCEQICISNLGLMKAAHVPQVILSTSRELENLPQLTSLI